MKNIIALFATVLFGTAAFAQQPQQQPQENPNAQKISFADIRTACQNPAQFHNQIAPANIQVSCRDTQNRWIADQEGSLPMQSTRYVTTSVYSDKYTVSPVTNTVPVAQQQMTCPRFKEVTETLETVRAVSCDEIIAFEGTETEFCAGALDALKGSNPESITTQDTGKVLDFCQASAAAQIKSQKKL